MALMNCCGNGEPDGSPFFWIFFIALQKNPAGFFVIVLGVPLRAEIIPFEPDAVNTAVGKGLFLQSGIILLKPLFC
jgi:hypothetical protein